MKPPSIPPMILPVTPPMIPRVKRAPLGLAASLVAVSTVLASLASAAPGQETAGPPQRTETSMLDFVAAMVGNKAILASQVTERWRNKLADDAKLPPALRKYSSPTKRHALWGYLLEELVALENTAQSARLMGRSPDEVEEQVQRLVQDELARRAEDHGGLNAFARTLGSVGRSMGSEAEEVRTQILQSMAYYQGVLRELREQRAMLATPKEMKAMFDANPERFAQPGSVKVAVRRFATTEGREAAVTAASEFQRGWHALPRPVTEDAVRAPDVHVIEVPLGQEGGLALKTFAPRCQPGDVSEPLADEGWVWILLCLERTEAKEATFADPAVQTRLRDEIANRRFGQIADRLFPEDRVGVRRLPWGEPAAMDRLR
ncbi:MAG: hypothetical protein R3F56_13235 [Planctomycetota bacterium]